MASSKDAVISISSNPSTEQTPLLRPKGRDDEEAFEGIPGASVPSAVFNLLTSIVGAGIMALPATQKQLGVVVGSLVIVLIGVLTDASLEILNRFSRACKVTSYGSVMESSFGWVGRVALQLCVIVNNIGLLIVYMIIIGDVLSGSTSSGTAHHTGVFEEWAGGSFWWNGRLFVLFITTVLVLVPLVSLKRVDSLRFSSAASIALAVVFIVITAWVTLMKLVYGEIKTPKLWPHVEDQFSFWKLFTAVPVIVTAFICHHSVHPIANELDDRGKMNLICRLTITISTSVYIATALFGYLLFGESTMADVLSNFDVDLGVPFGATLSAIVRIGYAVHLMLVYPMINFSLRVNLDHLLFPNAPPLSEDNCRFGWVTGALVVVVFICSTMVPNIWTVFEFTGATAAVALGLVFPGIIALRDAPKIATSGDKLVSLVMVVLAVVSSVTSLTTNALDLLAPTRKTGHRL